MSKLMAGFALAAVFLGGSVHAQDPVAVAQARHDHYQQIGKAAKAVREALKSPSPDMSVMRASAKTIAELAPQAPTWFPPGTGKDVVPKSDALPAIWERPDEFKKDMAAFAAASQVFEAATVTGKLAAVAASYPNLTDTCKTCHDSFRAKDEH